jgi:translation initiation factor IF-3
MADPQISPYQEGNYGQLMDLTQKIYEYQKNQRNRKKDQETIQSTRLTREYFCPDYSKQAEKIWLFAEYNKGKELNLYRRDRIKRH